MPSLADMQRCRHHSSLATAAHINLLVAAPSLTVQPTSDPYFQVSASPTFGALKTSLPSSLSPFFVRSCACARGRPETFWGRKGRPILSHIKIVEGWGIHEIENPYKA